jgi:outer membrane protein assembly factor BamB
VIKRFATPGAVRWTLNLGKPVTFIRWSPLNGLVISSGNAVHNVTSRGQYRWKFVAGTNHRLFTLDDSEVVWSPAFSHLYKLQRRGRQGWSREWSGKLTSDGRGRVYLLDAGSIASLGADGADRWRASPEGVRELEGPFICDNGILFHGTSGLQGIAVQISMRGSVIRETELTRGAVLIGAGPRCEPLVWQSGEVRLLNPSGHPIWRIPLSLTDLPFVQRLEGGFAFVAGHAERPARLDVVTDQGRLFQSLDLPVVGRLTAAKISPRADFGVNVLGLCLDVTSPCARPGRTRGPFNAILTSAGKDTYPVLVRHIKGHLNFTSYSDGGLIVASSENDTTTELTLRNASYGITWQVTLPGRLSAGPYVGPSGEVYIGTCHGWECNAPHLLISVTGKAPPPEEQPNPE